MTENRVLKLTIVQTNTTHGIWQLGSHSKNGCVKVSVVHDCGEGRLYKCGTIANPDEKFVAREVDNDPNDVEGHKEEAPQEEATEEEEEEVDLETLTKAELISLAEEHEIELPNRATKTEMVDFLAEAFDE
jgi:hypothetical protein